MREHRSTLHSHLTVLSVGYPLFPVCDDAAGGAEQILYLLDREFCNSGVHSLVIASEGSSVHGQLLASMSTDGEIDDNLRNAANVVHIRTIQEALRRFKVDLVHFHGLNFPSYVPVSDTPMLATLHLPASWYPDEIFRQQRIMLNCVSQSQAEKNGLPVVSNGIDTLRYLPAVSKGEYFLWLGRVCPEKGVHLALQAAKKADVRLLIAGPVHPFASHQEYFRDEVEPLLDEKRRYLGTVKGDEKLRLLAEARGLLVTSTVAETSSLVAMEAASSGTPVIALRAGALPEVVEHERTGFIAETNEELVKYIPRVSEIAPAECRETALLRFSAARMAVDYLALYRRILGTTAAPHDVLYAS